MKPTLVIMAAGMGSRFGGMKQIEPVGRAGEILMEYAIYDAMQCGFGRVVFIIKEEMYADFRAVVGDKIAKVIDVDYAFQKLDNLPQGFSLPENRVKPWGTGHAVMSCLGKVNEPFCVITADDFYGRGAFSTISGYLSALRQPPPLDCCMVGFRAENTMTSFGSVSRACCDVNEHNTLLSLTERTKLQMVNGQLHDLEENIDLPNDTLVSCTMFGFDAGILPLIERQFSAFLNRHDEDREKVEYYLPSAIDELIHSREIEMKVLPTDSHWYGFTYREDRDNVVAQLDRLTAAGEYPSPLWP